MPAQLIRALEPSDMKCDAGVVVGDASVRCNIEEHTLDGHLEPESVEGYCCGEYTSCPTWQAMKKVEDHGGDLRKIIGGMRDSARAKQARQKIREARLHRAQRLMSEDSAAGRAFRKRLAVGEFDQAARVAESA